MPEEVSSEPKKVVVENIFEPDAPKQHAMRVDLHEHPEIQSLGVQVENLNEKDWALGDTITLTVIGIERKGQTVVEGVLIK